MKLSRYLYYAFWCICLSMTMVSVGQALLPSKEVELPSVPSSGFNRSDWIVPTRISPSYKPETPADEGAFRFECAPGHVNWDDPIVHPGIRGGSAHLHQWFGNPGGNYQSTFASLRANSEPGTCAGGPLNNTAYWFPAMIRPQNSMVVVPDFTTIYYKVNRFNQNEYVAKGSNIKQSAARNLPRGLRWVEGFNLATGLNDPVASFSWACEDGTGGKQKTLTALAAQTNCEGSVTSGGRTYQARVLVRTETAPQCWDGVRLDSPDHRSHVKTKVQDGFGNAVCPATHPVILPAFGQIIWFSHLGVSDWSQWHLSSDRMAEHRHYANGESFHLDWFGAWDPVILDTWSRNCNGFRGANADIRNGVGGELCDGTALKRLHSNLPPPSPRYLPIPTRP